MLLNLCCIPTSFRCQRVIALVSGSLESVLLASLHRLNSAVVSSASTPLSEATPSRPSIQRACRQLSVQLIYAEGDSFPISPVVRLVSAACRLPLCLAGWLAGRLAGWLLSGTRMGWSRSHRASLARSSRINCRPEDACGGSRHHYVHWTIVAAKKKQKQKRGG